MRIALAVDNNMVTQHFGHCEYFVVYEVENKEIKGSEIIKNPPHQKGYLPKFLKENNINTLITGNIGQMAVNLMNELNIECIKGVSGDIIDVIHSYIDGSLETSDKVCDHEHHDHEHHHHH
jgi:predicted Fe-Mo cluster-binding NifX family protein